MAVPVSPAELDTRGVPMAPPARPRATIIATGFAVAATVTAFACLLGIYLTLRAEALAQGQTWLPEAAKIPLSQPNVMLFTLLMSVVTVQWAVDAVAKDDRPNAYIALAVTFLLGFAVVNMAAYLYSIMGLDVSTASPVPVLIYAISGLHLVMLLTALLFLALMAIRALGGAENARQHDGIAAAALWWDAMVAVFCIIWYAIYVTK